MVICTFYAHQPGAERITTMLEQVYPKAEIQQFKQGESEIIEVTIKGGLFKSASKIKISYRQRNEPSHQLPEVDDSALTANLKGLHGYVSSLPAKKEKVKDLFLRKIETLNCEFTLQQLHGETKDLKQLITSLAKSFDAVLFVQPGTVISRSNGQHFLNNDLKLIIDGNGNCEIDSLNITINTTYYDAPQSSVTEEQRQRKDRNDSFLTQKGIKVNAHLPCIESEAETAIRSTKEIAERVCVMAIISEFVFDNITADDAIDYLKAYDLWQYITPKEAALLTNPTDAAKQQETWKCECIWTLMWALNKVSDLDFPDALCSLSSIGKDKYPIGENKDPNDFINQAHEVRSTAEILDMNDLYYRIDWACVDARINGKEMTAVHPGVVYERHYALNWLINYSGQDWDDVSCDT